MPTELVLVLKQLGKVVGVVPIAQRQAYTPKKGEKLPKQAMAWVDDQGDTPVLKFYYKKTIYSTPLQP